MGKSYMSVQTLPVDKIIVICGCIWAVANNSLIIKKKLAATYGEKNNELVHFSKNEIWTELVHFKICELNFELVHVMNLVQPVDKKVCFDVCNQ